MTYRRLPAVVAVVLAATLALAPAVSAESPGKTISNVLEATLEAEKPGITVHDDLSGTSIAGLWDVFSVSTTPGAYAGEPVRVRIDLDDPEMAAGLKLEYYSDAARDFLPLSFDGGGTAWFGPAAGFPLTATTSFFRITWEQEGTYRATISLMRHDGSGFNDVLDEETVSVQVLSGEHRAIALQWEDGSEAATVTYDAGEPFELAARASLDNGVSHIDGVLYVIEVSQGGSAVGPSHVTATAGGTPVGYDQDGGFFYWGPRGGFTFGCVTGPTVSDCQETPAATKFLVTVHQPGVYTVRAYAVQLDPGEAHVPLGH